MKTEQQGGRLKERDKKSRVSEKGDTDRDRWSGTKGWEDRGRERKRV